MADLKISELAERLTLADTDELAVEAGGTTYKTTWGTIKSKIEEAQKVVVDDDNSTISVTTIDGLTYTVALHDNIANHFDSADSYKLKTSGIQNPTIYNVTVEQPLTPGSYYDEITSRSAVPVSERRIGLIVTYMDSATTWRKQQFIGDNIADWTNADKWNDYEQQLMALATFTEDDVSQLRQEFESHDTDTDNPHHVTAEQVGLGNVDNTSDTDKPVSTEQQTAIDEVKALALLADEVSLTTESNASSSSVVRNQESLSIDLLNEATLNTLGGELLSGALGVDAQIKLPLNNIESGLNIKFKFKVSGGFHNQAATKILASLGNDNLENQYQIGVRFILPTTDYMIPIYNTDFYTQFLNESKNYTKIAHGENLCGLDLFSIRKKVPTISDINISFEITATQALLKDGGITLNSWTLASYSSVYDLVEQIKTDIGADYELTHYGDMMADVTTDEIERFIATLVEAREEYDYVTKTLTGVTIYDSFEAYVPRIKDDWLDIVISIVPNSTNYTIRTYVENLLVNQADKGISLTNCNLFINRDVNQSETTLGAAVKDLEIITTTKLYRPKVYAMLMLHVQTYNTDGSEIGQTISSGRFEKVIKTALKYGWTFGTIKVWQQMMLGQIPQVDKYFTILMDDARFDYDSVAEVKKIYDKYRLKAATALHDETKFTSEAARIARILRDDFALVNHCKGHHKLSDLSYSQINTAISDSKQMFIDAGYEDMGIFVYAYGSNDKRVRRFMPHNGYNIGISTNPYQINYFSGSTRFNIERLWVDDEVSFSTVENYLNIENI